MVVSENLKYHHVGRKLRKLRSLVLGLTANNNVLKIITLKFESIGPILLKTTGDGRGVQPTL